MILEKYKVLVKGDEMENKEEKLENYVPTNKNKNGKNKNTKKKNPNTNVKNNQIKKFDSQDNYNKKNASSNNEVKRSITLKNSNSQNNNTKKENLNKNDLNNKNQNTSNNTNLNPKALNNNNKINNNQNNPNTNSNQSNNINSNKKKKKKHHNNINNNNNIKNNNINKNNQNINKNQNINNNINKNNSNINKKQNINNNKIKQNNEKNKENLKIEKDAPKRIINENPKAEKNEKQSENKEKKSIKKWIIIFIVVVIMALLLNIIIFVNNLFGNKIQKNISINNIDVSKLTQEQAKNKILEEYKSVLGGSLKYQYLDKEYEIKLEDINLNILATEATNEAYRLGRNDNILLAIKEYYSIQFGKEDINLNIEYDEEKLNEKIKEIEGNFYKPVVQYSYSLEEGNLKVKNGSAGLEIEKEQFKDEFMQNIINKNISSILEFPLKIQQPEEIDVDKIHSEVFVEVANAYYTTEPFEIHNEIQGVDFNTVELEEKIALDKESAEYVIPLQLTEPEIKVDDLGLYNDVLGEFTTAYANNPNRTVNLRLAASKINGKILMPGESFSYNEIVGERTYAAGYRNAAIYVNGEVEDGLAGGICQISSTLYDAVVFANLQVDERYNHARVPSYVSAGRDATVYWGSKDFKFTNNRKYPIKLSISVEGGYAKAVIYGMRTDNEYDISIVTSVVGRSNGYMSVNSYKVYKQNGVEVNREYIATDYYKI